MKYYFSKALINPQNPAFAVGFTVDKEKYSVTKLDLYMRILMLEDANCSICLLSLDNLCVSIDVYEEFEAIFKEKYPNSNLNIICTHTHYGPSLSNEKPITVCDDVYKNQVIAVFKEELNKIKLIDFAGYLDYHYLPFKEIGMPRVSKNDPNNVYAGVISIFDKDKRIGNLLFYNCHPTEDAKDTGYFSSAFIGAAIKELEETYKDEFFIYMQGACGDVSSRFTRKERSFKQTLDFGNMMAACFKGLINKNNNLKELALDYTYKKYRFKATFKEVPTITEEYLSKLKDAERNELLIGLAELKKYLANKDLPKYNDLYLARLMLGNYRLFFSPFELFSSYNNYINKEDTLLVCYSNGNLAYLLPVDNKEITYEYFLETTTNEDKKIVLDAINNM